MIDEVVGHLGQRNATDVKFFLLHQTEQELNRAFKLALFDSKLIFCHILDLA